MCQNLNIFRCVWDESGAYKAEYCKKVARVAGAIRSG